MTMRTLSSMCSWGCAHVMLWQYVLSYLCLVEGDASGSPAPDTEASGSQDNQGTEGPS